MNPGPSNFYVAGGTLRGDARCYVPRQADADLFDGLVAGEFCYVLTSRQMGKSSLMVHTAQRLREKGIAVVVLDLTAIGQNLTAEQSSLTRSCSMKNSTYPLKSSNKAKKSWYLASVSPSGLHWPR